MATDRCVGRFLCRIAITKPVINKLTNEALDPFAKIPEFKYCAIRIAQGGVAPVATG